MNMSDRPSETSSSHRAGFVPHRVRSLSVSAHVVLLFCILVTLYAGWHFYTPLMDNGWGDWDDQTWRRDAERRNTLATIFDPFLLTGHEAMDTSYVPVQSLLYHLSINVWDQGPWPIRVMGTTVHIINAILVLLLAFRFTGSIPGAHLASLFFLLWPRNASTTGWLCASLAHGLVLCLYLSAFLLMQTYLHRRGWWRMVVAVLLFILAITTKELSATLAGAIFLYDALVVVGWRRLWRWPIPWRELGLLFARSAPFFAVVVAAVILQSLKYETGYVNTHFGGMQFGLRNPIRLFELATLFLHWGPRWSHQENFAAMIAIYVAFTAGIWLLRRRSEQLFLLIWVPIILTPFTISNFRDVQTLGRYLYEASAVLVVLLTLLVVRLVRWRPILRWPVLCVVFVVLAIFVSSVGRIIR
jgi:predicted membrane protein